MPQLNELIKVNTIYDLTKISFMWCNAIREIHDEKFKELMAEGLFSNDTPVIVDPRYEWATQRS
jgi:hypothetical protein